MTSGDAETNRFVVPQWLPFNIASNQPEALSVNTNAPLVDTSGSDAAFASAYFIFQSEPAPFLASDLLGVAIRLGKLKESRQLAEYVLANPVAGRLAVEIANSALGRKKSGLEPESGLRLKIREARRWIHRFPMDAIALVEQARLYTIIGQKRCADRAIERALVLAPNDRYVVRSAIRFFIHRDDWQRAHEVARRAAKQTNDPWITALWVSTGTQLGVISKEFKSQFSTALGAKDVFLFAELLEACGTQEVLMGSEKHAKRAFRQAWKEPPKTVVAHSQWVLREKFPDLAGTTSIDFSRSSEAMAWVSLMRMDLSASMQSSREWILEEPFSTNAFMHGSFVESLREEYIEAEVIAREGLRANPGNHGLINNLAFALVGQKRILEAQQLLSPLAKEIEQNSDAALSATWGLVRMMQGAHKEGRDYYMRAIARATEDKDSRLALRALVNLQIAEIDSGGSIDPDLLSTAASSLFKSSDPKIVATAERLNARLRVHQSLFETEKEKAVFARFGAAVAHSSKTLKDIARQSIRAHV